MTDDTLTGDLLPADTAPTPGHLPAPLTPAALDVTGPLDADGARYVTEMIRSTADVMWWLLAKAHAGRAWEPLGYRSFTDYVSKEFNLGRSRAYQLLNQARVIEALKAAAPEGTRVDLPEATTRDLHRILDQITPEVQARTAGLDPDAASVVVAEIVAEKRAEARTGPGPVPANPPAAPAPAPGRRDPVGEYDDFDDDFDDDPEPTGFTGPGSGQSYIAIADTDTAPPAPRTPSPIDDLDAALDDDYDLPVPPTPPGPTAAQPVPPAVNPTVLDDDDEIDRALLRRRVQGCYDLYSILATTAELPDPQVLLEIIPEERRLQISQSLPGTVAWLTEFARLWAAQPWQHAS